MSTLLDRCAELDRAAAMCRVAHDAGLSGAELLDDLDRAARVCNGIGADWFPPWLRWLVTELHPSLEVVAWIHDVRYELGGGTVARLAADWEFARNGVAIALMRHGWMSWRRYALVLQCMLFFVLLRLGGAAAFKWLKKSKNEAKK